ncbi:MAG TPA: ATP-binding protein [Nitrosospira sp.]|nr:ATP-binding protein [Nitrosospira sp.]
MSRLQDNEEALLRSVALQTSSAILLARQRAEHELRQAKKDLEDKTRQLDHSLSILRATIEATAEGILVTDEEGTILRFNELYLKMWGIKRDLSYFSEHRQLLQFCGRYMKDPQVFFERTEKIYASWPPDTYDVLELTDGRVIERFSKIQYIESQNIGRVWTYRDITRRRRAEEAVRESGERLQFMADSMPLKIFMCRPDGEADYMNRQWLDFTGETVDKLLGWEWTKFIHPDDLEENVERWRHCLATGEPFLFEHRVKRADGEYGWHLTCAHAKRDIHGNISMWVGSSTDIDGLKRADEEKKQLLENERIARAEAERASQIKDEFLATLSHELRTPLNAILGWSQLIQQGTMSQENVHRGLETIERNARAQNKLIEDLLEMSSIISGKVRIDMQRVNLSAIAEAAVESVIPAAEAKGVRLKKKIDPATGVVSGDQDRLQQVIWNLLSNAIKFTPKGGNVEIAAMRAGSQVEVNIKDSGVGIRPEFLPYVFDRFRQADSSLTRHHGGLGLGLAIVKQLVGLHGGTVRAESPGEGKGASFVVSLPLAPVNYKREAARALLHTEGVNLTLQGIRILVVDDEEDSRELIREVLTDCEAEVAAAASAAEGLEMLKTQRPDVMISDIGMPGKDGYQLIREIRQLPASSGGKIPAIALTAFASSEDRTKAMIAGYQMHLSKPVEPHELVATIAAFTQWMH